MFFRRATPHEPGFKERLESLKSLGFTVNFLNAGHARVSRDGIGAIVEDRPGQRPHVNRAGFMIGDEIGLLVNAGYQMFWRTPSGRSVPAQASQLKSLHNFEEDLKEGLGLLSLYNESLGTTSDLHLYDRVEHRDEGDAHKPWQHKITGV
ncbi:MAG TPA: hypothetical protein VNX70_14535 [Bryobacteraceae bacterium]|jgi:hypothetical protein|nr:hypothetical protein [Bryobacteraceae bacterium]